MLAAHVLFFFVSLKSIYYIITNLKFYELSIKVKLNIEVLTQRQKKKKSGAESIEI